MLIFDQLYVNAGKKLNHPVFRFLDKETSYQNFLTLASRLSYLYKREIGHQARIAFFSSNCPAMAASFVAFTNIRCISTFIDPTLSPEQILEWIKATEVTHLAVSSDLMQKAESLTRDFRLSLTIIEIEKKQGGEYSTTFTPDADQSPKDTDPIVLVRTGGLTGPHKYIAFSHQEVLASCQLIRGHYRFKGEDRVFSVLNWSHPFALIHAFLLPLTSGITSVIDHGLKDQEFLNFLITSRVTRIIGIPSFFLKLLILQNQLKLLIPSLKGITVGLGFISPDLRKTFELLQISVSQVYGLSESFWTLAMEEYLEPEEKLPKGLEITHGFVGKALPGVKYKVIDKNGDELEGKTILQGALAISGAVMMKKYENLEKETKQAIRGQWLYTGDMVKLQKVEDQFYLTYLGRQSDFEASGFKHDILPKIDAALKEIVGLNDIASFFVKSNRGKFYIAIVAVKPEGSKIFDKQILEYCNGKLPQNLLPQIIFFTESIPRDAGGNPNYHRLRSQFSSIMD